LKESDNKTTNWSLLNPALLEVAGCCPLSFQGKGGRAGEGRGEREGGREGTEGLKVDMLTEGGSVERLVLRVEREEERRRGERNFELE